MPGKAPRRSAREEKHVEPKPTILTKKKTKGPANPKNSKAATPVSASTRLLTALRAGELAENRKRGLTDDTHAFEKKARTTAEVKPVEESKDTLPIVASTTPSSTPVPSTQLVEYFPIVHERKETIDAVFTWDMDDVLIDYDASLELNTKTGIEGYCLLHKEKVRAALLKVKACGFINFVVTSRYSKTDGHWLSIPHILSQIERYPGELFDGYFYTNSNYKNHTLANIEKKYDLEPTQIFHSDDCVNQHNACCDNTGYRGVLVDPKSDAYLDAVHAQIDTMLYLKNLYADKPEVTAHDNPILTAPRLG